MGDTVISIWTFFCEISKAKGGRDGFYNARKHNFNAFLYHRMNNVRQSANCFCTAVTYVESVV